MIKKTIIVFRNKKPIIRVARPEWQWGCRRGTPYQIDWGNNVIKVKV